MHLTFSKMKFLLFEIMEASHSDGSCLEKDHYHLPTMPTKLTERQWRLYHRMASATATDATGRMREGRYKSSTVDGSVVTLEGSLTIGKYGTSRRGNQIYLKEKEDTAAGV